jgi:aquaporin Z
VCTKVGTITPVVMLYATMLPTGVSLTPGAAPAGRALVKLPVAYAVGHVSGGHFNPAVTLGLAVAKRFAWGDVAAYIATQVVASVAAASVLFVVADGQKGFSAHKSGFAANGYGDHSPGHYSLAAALVIELVLTAFFLYIILGSTDTRGLNAFAPVAIGFALVLIHLISIPITNTSVNPARSTGVAFYAGSWALGQLWLFWLAPIVGAVIAGFSYDKILGGPGEVLIANAEA